MDVRGDCRYYYRHRRVGDTVQRVYLGTGNVAKQAAEKDAAAKAKRAAEQAELAALEAKLSGVDRLANDVHHGVATLAEAALLVLGYHEHRGQWRRHRNDNRT